MREVLLGVMAALAVIATNSAFNPPAKPIPCTASQDLKDVSKAQQATISELITLEKKALESLSQSCQK